MQMQYLVKSGLVVIKFEEWGLVVYLANYLFQIYKMFLLVEG